jgi:hypothetical protein
MSILISQVPTNFSQKLLFNKMCDQTTDQCLMTAAGIFNLAGELRLSLF